MAWHLRGDYLENCNCDILCPCITSSMLEPGDYERCLVPLAATIRDGERDGVRLDGLGFVLVVDSPPRMADGGWRVAVYLDERADERQREALGAILGGAEGGPPEVLRSLIGEQLGIKFVPLSFEFGGGRARVEIPGVLEVEVELLKAIDAGPVTIQNVRHPFGSDLPVARSLTGRYNDPDYGLSFDNTGKNGHVREFAWAA